MLNLRTQHMSTQEHEARNSSNEQVLQVRKHMMHVSTQSKRACKIVKHAV